LASVLLLLPVAPAGAAMGTREHPYKRGAVVTVDGGFAMRVLSIDSNAWTSARLKRSGGRPPLPGRSDVLVTMQATNRTRADGLPFIDGTLGAIGASGIAYSSITGSCGSIAGDVSSISPVPPGKTVLVYTCWQVSKLDVASLVMFYAPYEDPHRTYFALR
jgi:hypothetical protein